MRKVKIVFTDYYYPDNQQELEILNELGNVEIVDCSRTTEGGLTTEEQVIEKASDADAIITQFSPITAKVIDKLEHCKIIARYAIGVDNIDVKAAKDKGIVVANVPDYCIEEVSDTALAHILNCNRKVSLASGYLKNRKWNYDLIKPIQRLSDQTVGLIAFGNIAKRVAEKLRPYNLEILAFDPYANTSELYDWVNFVTLEELLNRSDIISIHAPLSEQTYHLINEKTIEMMKVGVIIVNTSRGGLIDETALIKGINEGKISMAGLDVLDMQDSEYQNSKLLDLPVDKVVVTPHMSWYSIQAIKELQAKAAMNVASFFQTGKPLYSV